MASQTSLAYEPWHPRKLKQAEHPQFPNGAEMMSWPDGGSTPYRGEKATNWEGRYRVLTPIRLPGVIEPGTIYSQFFARELRSHVCRCRWQR